MGGMSYYDRKDDGPIEWPPPPDKARRAAVTVAAITGDAEACGEVLEALGLKGLL